MKDRKSNVRYLGFQALLDGSRRFDFSFTRPDTSEQLITVEAACDLFSGPDHMAIQECAGICYETLRCAVECSGMAPACIKLTSADIEQHRHRARGRRRRRTA
jgi:hypothetical protein